MINIVAEIGINHNGDLEVAKRLIDLAHIAGCDYVKFQKRTPELCVPDNKKNEMKSTPWGDMTYLEYRNRVEFSTDQYEQIDMYCNDRPIKWFASVWDIESARFMSKFSDIVKIPSALITDHELLQFCRKHFDLMIISTGMSTEKEVYDAVTIGNPDVVMHTNSAYPAKSDELKLNQIQWLKDHYPNKQIGYSGHEFGLATTYATISMGIRWVERHVTLDHDMWGSDQKASVDPVGIFKLVRSIRDIEKALTGYEPRQVYESELQKRKDLRK